MLSVHRMLPNQKPSGSPEAFTDLQVMPMLTALLRTAIPIWVI